MNGSRQLGKTSIFKGNQDLLVLHNLEARVSQFLERVDLCRRLAVEMPGFEVESVGRRGKRGIRGILGKSELHELSVNIQDQAEVERLVRLLNIRQLNK